MSGPAPASQDSRSFLGRMFTPPAWTQPYLPHSWQEQLFTHLVDPKAPAGTLKPLVKPASDRAFVDSADPQAAKDFHGRAEYQYFASPVIREGSGETMSPSDWVRRKAQADGLNEEDANLVEEGVFRHLVGQKADGDAFSGISSAIGPMAKGLLDRLREHTPGQPKAQYPGWQEKDRNFAAGDDWLDGRYAMSPGLKASLNAQRAHGILSALQSDPIHRPDWSTTGSSLVAIPGAALSGLYNTARHMLTDAQVTKEDEHTEWAKGAMHLGYLRNLLSQANPAEARMREAAYWDRLADERNKTNRYRSSTFGGYGPGESWMTTQGMGSQADGDTSNYLTYAEKLKNLGFSGVNVVSGDQGRALREVIGDLYRPAPIFPNTAIPEEAGRIGDVLDRWSRGEEQQYIAEYPLGQRRWNESVGSLIPGTRVNEYSLPSPIHNNVAMAPKYWLDVPTLATLGAMAPRAIATGGGRALLQGLMADYARDQATLEQPMAAAMWASQPPYNTNADLMFQGIDYKTQGVVPVFPEQFNADGTRVMADPNSPDYPQHYQSWRESQQKLLDEILSYHRKHYGRSVSSSQGEP